MVAKAADLDFIQRKRLPAVRKMPRAIFPASDINSSNLNRGSFNFKSPSGRAPSPPPSNRARQSFAPVCNPPPLYSSFRFFLLYPPTHHRLVLASPVIPGFLSCLRRLRRPQSKVWGHTSPAGATSTPPSLSLLPQPPFCRPAVSNETLKNHRN